MALTLDAFLSEYYFLLFCAMALSVSVYTYRWYYHSVLKYLPILIGYTFLTEILGVIIFEFENIQIVLRDGYSNYNNLIYNVFDILFFLYFYYIFWKTFTDRKMKSIVLIGGLLFILTSLINPFFQDFILYAQLWASSIGSLVLILCILLFYTQTKTSTSKNNKFSVLLRWISLGLLVFYIFYPIILIIGHLDYSLYQKLHIRQLQHFLIAVMYLGFILGFLRMRRYPTKNI